MKKTTITLLKGKNRYKNVYRSLSLVKDQLKKEIKNKKRVVIKVNFVCGHKQLSATHVDAVRAFLDFVNSFCQKRIAIVEKGVVGKDRGFTNYGYHALTKKYQITLGNYSQGGFKQVKLYDVNLNQRLKGLYSKQALKSDFLVSITPAKTHDTGIVTLGLKNVAVGFLANPVIIHQGYQAFNYNLFELIKFRKPDFSIIDGTIGMEGDGPCEGTAKPSGWTLASLNSVQADVVAAHLMGFKPKNIGYLAYCLQANMATDDFKMIQVLGEKISSCRSAYQPHYAFQDQLKWNLAPGLKTKIRAKIITDYYQPLIKTELGKNLEKSPIKKIGKKILGFQ